MLFYSLKIKFCSGKGFIKLKIYEKIIKFFYDKRSELLCNSKYFTLIQVSHVILNPSESSNGLYVRNKHDLMSITIFKHLNWISLAKKLQIIRNYLWNTGNKGFISKLSKKHPVKQCDTLDKLPTSFAGTGNASIINSCDFKNTVHLHV